MAAPIDLDESDSDSPIHLVRTQTGKPTAKSEGLKVDKCVSGSKLLLPEQQARIVELLTEADDANEVIIKLRDATFSKKPYFGMELLSMDQISEGLRNWEIETLPSINDLKGDWVYPGRKARVPNRRIQQSFISENRTMLVGESTAIALRCHAHPDDVVETVATGHVRLPVLPEDFVIHIKSEVILKGLLSSPQLESVAYAARRFSERLPDGSIGGYCLGDGTGCGKGRVIAALIIHLWNLGYKRHLWVSVSKDLIQDAKRDLKDLGVKSIPVFDITEGAQDGVAFSTYALIGRRHGDQDRMKEFFDFFGENGGGLLCFDEAHKAKNLQISSVNAKRDAKNKGSKVALAVEEIQRLLPNAKVLYSSATAATEIKHMSYMTRLGLWGTKKSFPNFKVFESNLAGGGVAAMEMLAINMKAMGMLSCRSLAYTHVTFDVIHTKLLPRQKLMYDGSVEVFTKLKLLLKGFLSHPEISKQYLAKKKALFWMSYFYSVQQRFFKQLLVAYKVDDAVKLALSGLSAGDQVVLSMWGTGAARIDAKLRETEKQRKDDGLSPTDHDDLLSGPEMTLEHAIEQLILPLNADMTRQQQELIAQVKKLKLPANSLDDLIDKLGGPEKVAEMSGRTSRLLRRENGSYQYISRVQGKEAGEGVNLSEQRNFQSGAKRVAIITEAASTGISLHSDNRIQNKRRRLMITLELPWGADKAIQQFGRVHRSNQHCAPRFQILITPVSGEVRFASTIAQRLKWLGAMTKGDRNVAAGGDLADKIGDFDIHNIYGKRALSQFFQDLRTVASDERKDLYEAAIAPHLDKEEDFESFAVTARNLFQSVDLYDVTEKRTFQRVDELVESSLMNQFLNRILMFCLSMQNSVFDCFLAVYDELVNKDKEAGEFSEAQVSLNQQLMTVTLHRREHVHYDKSGAISDLVTLQLDRGVSWEIALKIYEVSAISCDESEGFYHFMAHLSKIKEVVLIRKSPTRNTYEMITPHNGVKSSAGTAFITKTTLGNTNVFQRVKDLKAAKEGWEWQREVACEKCIHIQRGFKCVKGEACKEGKRLLLVTLLSGAFLEVWGFLSQHIAGLSRVTARNDSRSLPLVSVSVEERTVVGVRLAPESVPEVSYVLRNMQSDDDQNDEDTCRELIEVYKKKPDQPGISTWIDAHKVLVPRIAQSKQGLTSAKSVWIALRAGHVIQELVGGGTSCRIAQAEIFLATRFRDKDARDGPYHYPPAPKECLPTRWSTGKARPTAATLAAASSQAAAALASQAALSQKPLDCMNISDDDSVGSAETLKLAKTLPSARDTKHKLDHMFAVLKNRNDNTPARPSPWATLQAMAKKRNVACAQAASSSDTSTATSSNAVASSAVLSRTSVPSSSALKVEDTIEPLNCEQHSDVSSYSSTSSASSSLVVNGAKAKIETSEIDVKQESDDVCASIRKSMKKLQKMRKWLAMEGKSEWVREFEKRRTKTHGAARAVLDEEPLNILSLSERRKLMRDRADAINEMSPKKRPTCCEDELLHMLFTPPKLCDNTNESTFNRQNRDGWDMDSLSHHSSSSDMADITSCKQRRDDWNMDSLSHNSVADITSCMRELSNRPKTVIHDPQGIDRYHAKRPLEARRKSAKRRRSVCNSVESLDLPEGRRHAVDRSLSVCSERVATEPSESNEETPQSLSDEYGSGQEFDRPSHSSLSQSETSETECEVYDDACEKWVKQMQNLDLVEGSLLREWQCERRGHNLAHTPSSSSVATRTVMDFKFSFPAQVVDGADALRKDTCSDGENTAAATKSPKTRDDADPNINVAQSSLPKSSSQRTHVGPFRSMSRKLSTNAFIPNLTTAVALKRKMFAPALPVHVVPGISSAPQEARPPYDDYI